MAAKKKQQQETIIRYCRDCVHSTPDMKFANLSLEGKPTLLSCPYKEWRIIINTTEVCDKYKEKEPEAEVKSSTDDWMDW